MSTKDGGSAFPSYENPFTVPCGQKEILPIGGMSLRDYFAAKAIQGFCANPKAIDATTGAFNAFNFTTAYAIADAMLAKREKEQS